MEKKSSFHLPDSLRDGWRRTKQTTKVKLGKADTTVDDDDYEQLVVTCKDQHLLTKRLCSAIHAHVAATKSAASTGQQLAQELMELYSDSRAEHRPLAKAHHELWTESAALSSRYLDTLMEQRVITPLQAQLEEYERLFHLLEERQKRRQDYDYYRTKTTTLATKVESKGKAEDEKEAQKVARNNEKLQHAKQVFDALTDETRQRMRELIAERYDFFGCPLTQFVAAERAFFTGIGRSYGKVEQWTRDGALSAAVQAMLARPSRRRESTALAQLGVLTNGGGGGSDDHIQAGGGVHADHRQGAGASAGYASMAANTNPFASPGDAVAGGSTAPEPEVPVVTMDEVAADIPPTQRSASERQPCASASASAASHDPWASCAEPAAAHSAPSSNGASEAAGAAAAAGAVVTPAVHEKSEQAAKPAQQSQAEELISFGGDSDPGEATAAPPVPAGDKYQALCDYAPADSRMLAITKGEVLYKEREEDGWFYGKNVHGQAGYFPPNYCRRI
mmetsp:Transcript_24250/g.65730  ORF Transcript_24250/g.65730 Transcript_24250/m.65730 type:complete len:506 (+) Transcript_24250:120-1637(+)